MEIKLFLIWLESAPPTKMETYACSIFQFHRKPTSAFSGDRQAAKICVGGSCSRSNCFTNSKPIPLFAPVINIVFGYMLNNFKSTNDRETDTFTFSKAAGITRLFLGHPWPKHYLSCSIDLRAFTQKPKHVHGVVCLPRHFIGRNLFGRLKVQKIYFEPGKWKLCKLNCASLHILISPSKKQYMGAGMYL